MRATSLIECSQTNMNCSLIHGKWLDIRATCAENEPHSARKRPDSPASGAPYHGTWRGFAHCSSGLRERAACPAATTQHKAAARVGADPPARSLSLRVASLSVSAVPSALSHRVLRGAEGPQRERPRDRSRKFRASRVDTSSLLHLFLPSR